MNKGIRSLYPSLVGSSIEFSFRKKLVDALPIEENIQCEKERILKHVGLALGTGGSLCVMLLAELTLFYREKVFYMAVRSSIEMRRYRPLVLEYMKLPSEDRFHKLYNELSKSSRSGKNRELKVVSLGYFVGSYPNRLKSFRSILTKEEFLTVA